MDDVCSTLIVTTTLHAGDVDMELARLFAGELNAPYVPRGNKSVAYLQSKTDSLYVLVVNREKPTLHGPEGQHFFHPSMSKVRIKSLQQGKIDQMIEAMALKEGDAVLDCTLGLAADAIVASFKSGPAGKVVGLEAVPVMAALARYGLSHYTDSNRALNEAMRRVEAVNADHREYLKGLEDNSYDIVYLDPMFRKPQIKSDCMRPMRALAETNRVETETIQEALRVARKRVVFKERRGSKEFDRLGAQQVTGGKFAAVAYGVFIK